MDTAVAILKIRAHLSEIDKILSALGSPPPDNVTALPAPREEGLEEFEGRIGRPEFKTINGKQLWTAGLGIKEGNVTRWVSLVAWGNIAESAATITRGQIARVVGKTKESRYIDSGGVMQVKTELVASSICPVEYVGSGSTPSRASANGTT